MKTLLPPGWQAPREFFTRLGEGPGRQRAMFADGHLLLVLHEPPEPGEAMRGRLFWREPDGSWKSNSLGTGIQSLRQHVAEFAERIDKLEDRLQVAVGANDYFAILQAIVPLYRGVRNLHGTLQSAREMVPDDREIIVLRDRAGEAERAAELVHGDAKNGLDFTIARQAELQAHRGFEMAVSAHRLNILAAIFFPIATVSAIFGMNLKHGVVAMGAPWDFWGLVAFGLISGLLLTAVITTRPISPTERRGPREGKRGQHDPKRPSR